MRALILASVLIAATQPAASAPDAQLPDFRIEVWGFAIADFSARMDAYAALRRELEQGLPALKVTNDPAEIVRTENMLAIRIRQARRHARRGDIFTPNIRAAFRELLRSRTTPGTCELIKDDNPGEFGYDVNGTYPKTQPVSTVPASMLAVLPRLPADIQYRFLRRDLILHDLRANVILDRIENAITCPPAPRS
jgi:hypothetical protein